MNDRETARYDKFGRVQTFGTDNAADFAPVSKALDHFAQIIKDIDKAKATQINAGVTAKEVLLGALRIDIRRTDRAAIDSAKNDIEGEDLETVQSTAAIGRLIRTGMKEINYLNAIMHNKYSRDGDKLRAWKSASHIERAPQRAKSPSAPGSGTPQPSKP